MNDPESVTTAPQKWNAVLWKTQGCAHCAAPKGPPMPWVERTLPIMVGGWTLATIAMIVVYVTDGFFWGLLPLGILWGLFCLGVTLGVRRRWYNRLWVTRVVYVDGNGSPHEHLVTSVAFDDASTLALVMNIMEHQWPRSDTLVMALHYQGPMPLDHAWRVHGRVYRAVQATDDDPYFMDTRWFVAQDHESYFLVRDGNDPTEGYSTACFTHATSILGCLQELRRMELREADRQRTDASN